MLATAPAMRSVRIVRGVRSDIRAEPADAGPPTLATHPPITAPPLAKGPQRRRTGPGQRTGCHAKSAMVLFDCAWPNLRHPAFNLCSRTHRAMVSKLIAPRLSHRCWQSWPRARNLATQGVGGIHHLIDGIAAAQAKGCNGGECDRSGTSAHGSLLECRDATKKSFALFIILCWSSSSLLPMEDVRFRPSRVPNQPRSSRPLQCHHAAFTANHHHYDCPTWTTARPSISISLTWQRKIKSHPLSEAETTTLLKQGRLFSTMTQRGSIRYWMVVVAVSFDASS